MSKSYVIKASDGKTKATIFPERGGWVSSLRLPLASGTREVLFQHDYAEKPEIKDLLGGIPFLFPICGRLSRNSAADGSVYLYDGKLYSMRIHGFSWFEAWTVGNVTQDSIEMKLRANERSAAIYPFQFEVCLKYEVQPGKLLCYQKYSNCETVKRMPYYAGFHPYFLIPGDKSKTTVQFESTRRLKYNDTLTDIIGEQPIIQTPISITDPSINEQLSVLSDNKKVILKTNDDIITVNVVKNPAYFPYLQLYHILEKPFFCIEHWMGFPNAMNSVVGVRWLEPGESDEVVYEISNQ